MNSARGRRSGSNVLLHRYFDVGLAKSRGIEEIIQSRSWAGDNVCCSRRSYSGVGAEIGRVPDTVIVSSGYRTSIIGMKRTFRKKQKIKYSCSTLCTVMEDQSLSRSRTREVSDD